MKWIVAIALIATVTASSAQEQQRLYGTNGRSVGTVTPDSQGSITVRDSSGRVTGRATTDSQGTTIFYDAAGRKTGTAVPNGVR